MSKDVQPLYVLLHGWGFDAGFWEGVRARLPADDVTALDWGYFGGHGTLSPLGRGQGEGENVAELRTSSGLPAVTPPHPEPAAPPSPRGGEGLLAQDRPLVAVGHSFGAMLLLRQAGVKWAGFVAVNGFARFSQAEDYPGVRRRVIDQMLKRFEVDPAAVLADFRARCGAAEPPPPGLDVQRLRAGLTALRDDDGREQAAALECPALLLAGDADPIVPAETTGASAACFRHATVEWLAGGGHLLPRLAPDWCVGHLTAFAARLTGD